MFRDGSWGEIHRKELRECALCHNQYHPNGWNQKFCPSCKPWVANLRAQNKLDSFLQALEQGGIKVVKNGWRLTLTPYVSAETGPTVSMWASGPNGQTVRTCRASIRLTEADAYKALDNIIELYESHEGGVKNEEE